MRFYLKITVSHSYWGMALEGFLCNVLLMMGMLNPTCWKDFIFQGLLLDLILQRLSEFSIKNIPNPKNNQGLEGRHTQVPSRESQIVKLWINEHILINN